MLRPVYIVPLAFIIGFCGHAQAGELRTKRGSPDFTKKLWESPIPYTLDNNFNEEEKTIIRAGIKTFIDNTCVDFTEVKPGPMVLEYFAHPAKCEAEMGDQRSSYKNGTNQRVLLAPDCRMGVQGVQHETMHALGFDHTSNRPDRDSYVTIPSLENMNETEKAHFNKQKKTDKWTDYGIPYEYGSILHVPAAKPIDPDYQTTTDGSVGLVFNDWKLINLHYKCPEKCATNIKCVNDGYLHPHNCNECVCPRFYTGTRCEVERNPLSLTMGEPKPLNFHWTGDLFSSDKIITPDEYLAFPSTDHLIKAPEGTRILIKIVAATDKESRADRTFSCAFKAIEIVDGDLTRVGKRFCGRNTLPYEFLSETNIIGYHAFAKPGLDFVADATFTAVDASYVLPPTTTTIPPPTTATMEALTKTTTKAVTDAVTDAVTKPPRIPVPVPRPEPETIILKSGDPPKQIDDTFTRNMTLINDEIKYDPSEYWRKPDRTIKGPEGSRIRIKINNITDIFIKKGGGRCIHSCTLKAIAFVEGEKEIKRFCCNDKIDENGFTTTTNTVVYEMYTTPGVDFTASVTFTVVPGPAAN